MPSVYSFNRAIARRPAASSVDGLRAVDVGAPDIRRFRDEHETYVAALAAAGVAVEVLDALEPFPDSVFVEDPALVFPEGAILLRPGAPTRLGEAAEIAPALAQRFDRFVRLGEGGYTDGGDVLVTPGAVYIGLSARTDRAGAAELAAVLADFGRKAVVVEPPAGILHLKTGCSLLDDETILVTAPMKSAGLFAGMRLVEVGDGEDAAANALRINGKVLLPAGFPRTGAILAAHGYDVVSVPVHEAMKLDAGLSCMSLRWFDPAF